MIGIIFLAAAVIWLAISLNFSLKVPIWLGVRGRSKPLIVSALLLAVLLVGPFVDEIIGMRQFEKLCEEARANIWVSPEISSVKRAISNSPNSVDLSGYVIPIKLYVSEYIDLDSGSAFLRFRTYFTKGGRLWGLTLMGGKHSCEIEGSPRFIEIWKEFNIEQLMNEGRKK